MRAIAIEQGGLTGIGRAGVIALIVVAMIGRAIFVVLPVNSDTAMFVYAGKLVAEGGRPGVDLLDNKLPTVGLLMSVPWRLFGGHWPAYGVLGLVLSLLASWFLWRAARDVWGATAGIVVLIASVVWLNFPPAVYGQFQLETIQAFFASIAAATTLRLLRRPDWRDALLVGLCAGMAAWAKPTAMAVAGAAVITLIVAHRRQSIAAVVSLIIGVAIPLATAAAIVVVTGMADALPGTLRQLKDYSRGSSLVSMDFAKPAMVVLLLVFPLLVIGVICRRDKRPPTAMRADVLFVSLWFTAELTGIVLQRRMYSYHFLPLGPPAAMAVGLLARRVSLRSIAMAFGPIVAAAIFWSVVLWSDRSAGSREASVIAYLDRHAAPRDAVWADDYPRLLVETGRRAGSTVPLIFLMANGDGAPDFFGRRILADFEATKPAYVVFASDPKRLANLYRYHMSDTAASPARADAVDRQVHAIANYLAANYRPVADFGSLRVWRH